MSGAVFWASVGLILYAHGGYPLVIFLLGLVLRKPISASEKCQPTVTIIITAYNEEKHIAKKLENTLHLDYPDNKLEIVVASDGSTDGTDEIVLDYSDRYKTVKLCRVEGRVGKTETQNRAVAMAKGEIVVFSDATTDYKVDAITKMVRNYADPTVGAVSGRYDYLAEKGSGIGVATTLFWRYENFIKSCQARIGTITGCCGCIYSVRKSLYERLDSEIISDLVEPLKILRKGYRIAFETEAIAWERTTERSFEELEMRIRVISRGMNGLWHMKELLNPGNYGFIAFQLLSHKVLRWWMPILMGALLVSNWFLLGHWFYNVVFYVQMGVYALALAGLVAEAYGVTAGVLSVPLYFCVGNIACLIGLVNFVKGEKKVVWETARK